MFITIVLFTIGLIVFFTFRDRIQASHLSSKAIQQILDTTSRYISLEQWDRAEKALSPIIENKQGGKKVRLIDPNRFLQSHRQANILRERYWNMPTFF